jgi:hypothetical protein
MTATLTIGMPWAEYIADGYIGSSALDAWGTMSLEAWSREYLEESYAGKATRWTSQGSYLDSIVPPTPDVVPKKFAVIPETYTNEKGKVKPWRFGAKFTDAWKAERIAAGEEMVDAEQVRNARAALPLVREALGVMEQVFKAPTINQPTLRGELHGIRLQTRPDMMIGRNVPDLKYVNPKSFDGFDRSFVDSRYLLQAGLFFGLMRDATGEAPEVHFILAESETDLPRCEVVAVPGEVLEAGWARVQSIVSQIAEALDSSLGFVSRVKFRKLNLPAFARARIGVE